ncbi:hypothetical protein BU24DRAFT_213332 [Aaosphaeria arxii CBS 175.79]|uniref:Uncharacterized protein n=1 Tax=Aaosphaeria arxii CBS 175.79 TaxID=1450172 RepID=A0A6A5XNN9_9PLEO|nr:uncharacterized protein BU24DRAFT_213332 [Aaosphaeria arxii CBS 175.79]KAF2014350.1 hypothetical protein BU24DRAFT_213332 [Aaosphaeria arxii CBS 175.79]
MCDAIFTFGQRGSHFFQCPSRRDYTRIPKKLQRILATKDIAHVYHVTLGFENSFMITYRDRNGNDHIEFQGLPSELTTFLTATHPTTHLPLRSLPSITLTLGPENESFFVGDGTSYLWMNLPGPLLSALQSRISNGSWTDKPRLVALGASSNFLLITQNNAAVWDLPAYRTLGDMMLYSQGKERGIEEVWGVVLHAYRYQGFVAMSRNGTVLGENLPEWSLKGLEGLKAPIGRDVREEEVRRRQRVLAARPGLGDRERSGNERLRPQATLRRQWGKAVDEWADGRSENRGDDGGRERERERQKTYFKTQAKGMKLSLSLSIGIGAGGLTKILG